MIKMIRIANHKNVMLTTSVSGDQALRKILIIEDQEDVRKLIHMSLGNDRYTIHEASNGDTGLALAEQLKPDLILMDIMMPGIMNGYQICGILKEREDFKNTKIIFLTARAQEQDMVDGYRSGCDEYLVKPFSPIRLAEIVDSLLWSDSKTQPEHY
ncbi:response regulator receiver domain protein (CheY-like) [Methylobacillus flagellatus KT]|uniref:Response regulator receiver domain protein (CheY-like) n=2 Tax=Methylobacillus flagellatus TaxID=405 RepID=Q1H1T8_METFK|nr:response regulator receiver domain protein (CheY-like) [Methylobacillus flagellatus KT]